MVKSPETQITGSLLKSIFELQLYAEYKTIDDESAIVFKIGPGGNGGELHLIDYPHPLKSSHPPVDRVAITIDNVEHFDKIVEHVKDIDMQHQIIQHEEGIFHYLFAIYRYDLYNYIRHSELKERLFMLHETWKENHVIKR